MRGYTEAQAGAGIRPPCLGTKSFGLRLPGLPVQDGKLCAHPHQIMVDLRK